MRSKQLKLSEIEQNDPELGTMACPGCGEKLELMNPEMYGRVYLHPFGAKDKCLKFLFQANKMRKT